MIKKSSFPILATFIVTAQPALAGSTPLPDRIEYVSGGIMSLHSELKIDLESGEYRLAQPKGGALEPVAAQQGRLSADHLANIRALATKVVKLGFKTPNCLRVENSEARRRRRLQPSQITIDLPSMDGSTSFWVRVAGQVQAAPVDEGCWTDNGKALQHDMFAAAHADLGSEAANQPVR
ncbi:hypothetical protein [Sphingobium sp. EM0848]|uniref:hypothetical protein n=1 Tax=Sphingobium sp. EM0848 TaxID=2743473 RepID=UPI00159C9B25|nr:hypothetical protein [Sphingobium sp. EM0848]